MTRTRLEVTCYCGKVVVDWHECIQVPPCSATSPYPVEGLPPHRCEQPEEHEGRHSCRDCWYTWAEADR